MTCRPARVAIATAALALALPAAASAATPARPMQLPGDAGASTASADASTWIVGARPGAAASRVARAFGASRVGPAATGGYAVATRKARGFAAALRARGLLIFAEPNVLRRTLAIGKDPFDVTNRWRDVIANPATLTPPPVTSTSPLIALVDAAADVTHPDLRANVATLPGGPPVTQAHGTATASVAAAAVNGVGMSGVWPGARALNVPLGKSISCKDSANGIAAAVRAHASVINMSYGSPSPCYEEYVAVQFAVAAGAVPVAAGGNEGGDGNPVEFPASLPHVVTVAALTPSLQPAAFSNRNAALDLAAPGVNITTAVPVAFDEDATKDGYELQSGTSFAAPMVSAAIAWIRAIRPDLRADQAVDLVRYSAIDVPPAGYDSGTGYGRLSLDNAVPAAAPGKPVPPHDPGEPNDDIVWVNGDALGIKAPLLYWGKGKLRLAALLDALEDPEDVYRVAVRGHHRIKVSARPVYGHITLEAYSPAAKSLTKRRRVDRSARPGGKTERITIRNRSRRKRTYYVALNVAKGRRLDAGYILKISR